MKYCFVKHTNSKWVRCSFGFDRCRERSVIRTHTQAVSTQISLYTEQTQRKLKPWGSYLIILIHLLKKIKYFFYR